MSKTTFAGLSQRTTAWAIAEALDHKRPIEVLADYGLTRPVPRNKAALVKFRRPVILALAKTPLTEGTPPASKAMSYEDVPATLRQYGDVVEITDVVQDLAEDPVLKDAMELVGEQSGETVESLLWGVLKGSTNKRYASSANGSNDASVNERLTTNLQRKIVRSLKDERGKKMTKKVSSSVQYGTEAMDAAFLAFAHTNCESDIRDMTGFVACEKYGSMVALPYEIGKVEDVRYICSPVLDSDANIGSTVASAAGFLSTDGTNNDVYSIAFVAKDAYGHISLKGSSAMKLYVTSPEQASKSDPLGQKGTVGWKTYWDGVILNQAWMSVARVVVSDLL